MVRRNPLAFLASSSSAVARRIIVPSSAPSSAASPRTIAASIVVSSTNRPCQQHRNMSNHPDTKVDCSKVYVKKSSFATAETGDFDGAFAAVAIKKGELVEKGIMRRLPYGFDGMNVQEIFTWSDERPNKTWAMGSGCSPYYNTDREGKANTKMDRFFDEDRFEIYAVRDIAKDEELTHTYKSLKWRTCFETLNKIVHSDEPDKKEE